MRKILRPAQPHEMELIDAYLEHMRRAGATEATLEGRSEILHRLNRDLPDGIGQTDTEELSRWLYRDSWSQNTRATYWRALRSFYSWACNPKDPWLNGDDPTDDMTAVQTVRGVPRPVTDAQLARILTESPDHIRLWSLLAAYEGLRCVEISRLDREHVSQQQLIVVRGKGGKPRVHDTHPDVWDAMKDLPRGPVAIGTDGERLTPFEVSLQAAHFFRRQLKMPGVSLHKLRYWLGVNVQRLYRDIRVTQAALGHVALSSTQLYTLATDEQQQEARSMLPRFGG